MDQNNPQTDGTIKMTNFEGVCYSYFESVVLLWENEHYITAVKLLLMNIDTMAYLQYRDTKPEHFKQWLMDYVDLSDVGVTADEVWEHRNALLHTSTLLSRAVRQGKIAYLVPGFGSSPNPPSEFKEKMKERLDVHYSEEPKFYSIEKLYGAVLKGVQKFVFAVENDTNLQTEAYENFMDLVAERSVIAMMKKKSN
jgi:hypothetical protein